MCTRWFFLSFCLLFLGMSTLAHAQDQVQEYAQESPEGIVQGTVVDGATEEPLSYATVSLYQESDSSFVIGGMAGEDGSFELEGIRAGRYFVEVSFAGYESSTIDDIVLSDARQEVDVGTVELEQESARRSVEQEAGPLPRHAESRAALLNLPIRR